MRSTRLGPATISGCSGSSKRRNESEEARGVASSAAATTTRRKRSAAAGASRSSPASEWWRAPPNASASAGSRPRRKLPSLRRRSGDFVFRPGEVREGEATGAASPVAVRQDRDADRMVGVEWAVHGQMIPRAAIDQPIARPRDASTRPIGRSVTGKTEPAFDISTARPRRRGSFTPPRCCPAGRCSSREGAGGRGQVRADEAAAAVKTTIEARVVKVERQSSGRPARTRP